MIYQFSFIVLFRRWLLHFCWYIWWYCCRCSSSFLPVVILYAVKWHSFAYSRAHTKIFLKIAAHHCRASNKSFHSATTVAAAAAVTTGRVFVIRALTVCNSVVIMVMLFACYCWWPPKKNLFFSLYHSVCCLCVCVLKSQIFVLYVSSILCICTLGIDKKKWKRIENTPANCYFKIKKKTTKSKHQTIPCVFNLWWITVKKWLTKTNRKYEYHHIYVHSR